MTTPKLSPEKLKDAMPLCPFCKGSVQRTDHLDSDDVVKSSTVRCKPCGYTIQFEKFLKRAAAVELQEALDVAEKALQFYAQEVVYTHYSIKITAGKTADVAIKKVDSSVAREALNRIAAIREGKL